MRLAVEGDLIEKHGVDDGKPAKLIVVCFFADRHRRQQVARAVERLLGE